MSSKWYPASESRRIPDRWTPALRRIEVWEDIRFSIALFGGSRCLDHGLFRQRQAGLKMVRCARLRYVRQKSKSCFGPGSCRPIRQRGPSSESQPESDSRVIFIECGLVVADYVREMPHSSRDREDRAPAEIANSRLLFALRSSLTFHAPWWPCLPPLSGPLLRAGPFEPRFFLYQETGAL